MVDLNSLNKTGCCYMSCNFSVKQLYIHFKKKHFEKLQEIIGGSEDKGKHEARLEFLQVKRAKFFRVKSKELKYDRQDCRSAEEDLECWWTAEHKWFHVCSSEGKRYPGPYQQNYSQQVMGCSLSHSAWHLSGHTQYSAPRSGPPSSRETLKNGRRFLQCLQCD